MDANARKQDLADSMETLLLSRDYLNEQGKRNVKHLAASLARLSKGYFHILPEQRDNTAQLLAERWYSITHDPANPWSFRGGKRKHSFYNFAAWIDRNYLTIALTRKPGALTNLKLRVARWLFENIT